MTYGPAHLRLYAAYALSEQVRHDAAQLGKQGRLSADYERRINRLANLADAGLNRARDFFFDGIYDMSDGALDRVERILTEALLIMQHEGKPKP